MSQEKWRFDTGADWCHLYGIGHFLFFALRSDSTNSLVRLDRRTGEAERLFDFPANELVEAVTTWGALLRKSGEYSTRYLDFSGKLLNDFDFWGSTFFGSAYLFVKADLGERLVAISSQDGLECWEFRAEPSAVTDRSNTMGSGQPSVVAISSTVLVVLRDGRVFSLDLHSGKVLNEGHLVHGGEFIVTQTSIFCARETYLSEFDHRTMKEVRLIEFGRDLLPLYGGISPTVNAFCLTTESLIWTTMHGVLTAISLRKDSRGRRRTWSENLNCIMPLGVAPQAWDNYLYVQEFPPTVDRVGRLLCFTGS